MASEIYSWSAKSQFRNRTRELARLEAWWADSSVEPLAIWGRRRVGKSWLFRRLADGKPAVILVADRVSQGLQLQRIARDLEEVIGFRPQLDDIAALFTTLFRLAREQKTLVVIDELPYLLGTSTAEQQANLTTIQAVMEQERDSSQIKLVLAGSTIAVMEELLAEKNPLHGRLVPFAVRPLGFAHARQLMGERRERQGHVEELTHFAISGGMPRYLKALDADNLLNAVTRTVLDPNGALFNEPRTVIASELREPAMYFSILSSLAVKPALATEIATDLRLESRELSPYLQTLESLQLVSRYEPIGGKPRSRGASRWRCDDDFIRFWFRFVEPYQGELEAGADPGAFMRRRVMTEWMRQEHRDLAPVVGSWWGSALHPLRRAKERFSEEIDVVVVDGTKVVAVAEAKWTNSKMRADVLTDLDDYKLPALAQAGFDVSGADIVLAAKVGFSKALRELSAGRPEVRLLPAESLLEDLSASSGAAQAQDS